jgi:hypothetical protein
MGRVSWYAVDAAGMDLATGRTPQGTGWPSPAAALAAAPVAAWPVAVVDGCGHRRGFVAALGPGGERVGSLLTELTVGAPVDVGAVASGARLTPAGPVSLPLAIVPLAAGVQAAGGVDRDWLAAVDAARVAARDAVLADGRADALEAAVHVAALVATERLDPVDDPVAGGDADADGHVASGAQLWLLTGAVASALSGRRPDPFAPWASLVAAGWWPVGPCRGRLVVSATGPAGATGATAR